MTKPAAVFPSYFMICGQLIRKVKDLENNKKGISEANALLKLKVTEKLIFFTSLK